MKVSLRWIFDHIKGSWRDYSVEELVARFNKTTAEIDGFESCSFDVNKFFVARCVSVSDREMVVQIPERKKQIALNARADLNPHEYSLVCAENGGFRWATYADLVLEKDGLLPAIAFSESEVLGGWRDTVEADDIILEIDNKSLTNRPDLWGHRGIAREIAAYGYGDLIPEEHMCSSLPVRHFERRSSRIELETSVCDRYAGIDFEIDRVAPSPLWMVLRLGRVGQRSFNAIIDATNYVMFDIGQPLHAFDADFLTHTIKVRQAQAGEKIELLDGSIIELVPEDCVIADTERPLVLAGVMGGRMSGVTEKTKKVFLESAHFDAAAIRLASARHKKRTESSMRFEKSLDPQQNTLAIQRYSAVLHRLGVAPRYAESIISVGRVVEDGIIELSHRLLAEKLGVSIAHSTVESILKKLGFGVQLVTNGDGAAYRITVPSYRGSKDIKLPEDVIEEVGRFYGYDNIIPSLPARSMKPFSVQRVMRRRALKHHLAFTSGMREVATYPLYDEKLLAQFGLSSEGALQLKNPVSDNQHSLVTSLIPHILGAVLINHREHERLDLFEVNASWPSTPEGHCEQQRCCGVLFDRSSALTFYDGKESLQKLFVALGLLVEWRKPDAHSASWFDRYEVAQLWSSGECIGWYGKIADQVQTAFDGGVLFAFDINVDFMLNYVVVSPRFEPLPRYQPVTLDVSVLVGDQIAVGILEEAIALSDARIREVELRDSFTKQEWGARRSLMFRYRMYDEEKTMTKQEIDEVQFIVQKALKALGAEIR